MQPTQNNPSIPYNESNKESSVNSVGESRGHDIERNVWDGLEYAQPVLWRYVNTGYRQSTINTDLTKFCFRRWRITEHTSTFIPGRVSGKVEDAQLAVHVCISYPDDVCLPESTAHEA